MTTFDAYWGILSVFGFISFVIYILIIATIIRYRKENDFKSSFFALWISLGIADCYMFLHSYILMRLPLLQIFGDFYKAQETGFLPNYAIIGVYYMMAVQLLGNALFALNRYSALTNAALYEQVRRKFNNIFYRKPPMSMHGFR